jgi:uncharacterized protein YndB with AHSA1/START domain
MGKRSTHHATFVIERNYAASPALVFAAWAEPKARWFVGSEDPLVPRTRLLPSRGQCARE